MQYPTARSALGQRVRAVVALAVVPFLLYASAAAAEIFKCASKEGAPRYQNFPCPIDSLGLPSDPSAAKPAASAVREQPKTEPAAAATKLASTGQPRVGMTGDEVRSLLGDPETVEEDELVSGRVSTWRYADGRTLQFDHKQRVVAVHR